MINPRQTLLAASLFALALAPALGCEDEAPPALDQVGDPCRHPAQSCVDEGAVLRCEGGVRAIAACDTVCAELGPAYVAAGCERGCVCVLVEPEGCAPGETVCADPETLLLCSAMQSWEPQPCAQLCEATQLESLGCLDQSEDWDPRWNDGYPAACWCTSEGTACEAQAQASCVDESTLAACVDGVWEFADCALSCAGPGRCDPWLGPAACAC